MTDAAAGVSVVLPVHGNAATLPELRRRIHAALADRPCEIVMVDDASRDDSLAVMRRLGVKAIALPSPRGQNAAILAGLAQATEPFVCVMDADLQDPPEALPQLLAALGRNGARVVFSSREAPRRWSSLLFRRFLRLLFPSLAANPCLCFAIDERARGALLAAASPGDYLVAVIGALGLSTQTVPVRRAPRPAGASGYAGWKRTGYAARMIVSAVRLRARASGFEKLSS